jgi:hypothetical protein
MPDRQFAPLSIAKIKIGIVIDDQPRADEELAIQQGVVAFGDAHAPARN